MDKREINRNKDKEALEKMTYEELHKFLYEVQHNRIALIDVLGPFHPEIQEIEFLLDATAGELIKRLDGQKNSNVTKPETPKCPDTFYQLYCLGA